MLFEIVQIVLALVLLAAGFSAFSKSHKLDLFHKFWDSYRLKQEENAKPARVKLVATSLIFLASLWIFSCIGDVGEIIEANGHSITVAKLKEAKDANRFYMSHIPATERDVKKYLEIDQQAAKDGFKDGIEYLRIYAKAAEKKLTVAQYQKQLEQEKQKLANEQKAKADAEDRIKNAQTVAAVPQSAPATGSRVVQRQYALMILENGQSFGVGASTNLWINGVKQQNVKEVDVFVGDRCTYVQGNGMYAEQVKCTR